MSGLWMSFFGVFISSMPYNAYPSSPLFLCPFARLFSCWPSNIEVSDPLQNAAAQVLDCWRMERFMFLFVIPRTRWWKIGCWAYVAVHFYNKMARTGSWICKARRRQAFYTGSFNNRFQMRERKQICETIKRVSTNHEKIPRIWLKVQGPTIRYHLPHSKSVCFYLKQYGIAMRKQPIGRLRGSERS